MVVFYVFRCVLQKGEFVHREYLTNKGHRGQREQEGKRKLIAFEFFRTDTSDSAVLRYDSRWRARILPAVFYLVLLLLVAFDIFFCSTPRNVLRNWVWRDGAGTRKMERSREEWKERKKRSTRCKFSWILL